MENPIKMDDLGGKTTIFGNIHFLGRVTFQGGDLRFNFPGGR